MRTVKFQNKSETLLLGQIESNLKERERKKERKEESNKAI